jgi:hypothetical protein
LASAQAKCACSDFDGSPSEISLNRGTKKPATE